MNQGTEFFLNDTIGVDIKAEELVKHQACVRHQCHQSLRHYDQD